ncbi:uncharacterized protein C9orf57 homolog [Alligator sinensis]|uniref:Uncharacterized protein C9orf57 homolog n=1 Tax=Alligator sinensis TaxID=38654 RepID=A0A3Q0FP66_ALLSI|nr:uncharacterized protein C9orf57 homolog [Alligator sinensis]
MRKVFSAGLLALFFMTGEALVCRMCLQTSPYRECTDGGDFCLAGPGQYCQVLRVIRRTGPVIRIRSCTKTGSEECGLTKEVGPYSLRFTTTCCRRHMCNR